jgi:hypothetical protein
VRQALTSVLVSLAAVLLFVGMVAGWADHVLLSPSRWETTSTKLLDNPTIRTSTATYLADQVDARLQLSRLPASELSSALGSLDGTSVAAVQAAVFRTIDDALSLPPAQVLWARANGNAATAVVNLVEDQGEPLTGASGGVTLNLGPILQTAATEAHLPVAVTAALPADVELTVVRPDQVHTVQTAGRVVRDLAQWLLVVVPALWLVALALAGGWRRRTLAWIGATTVLAGALVLGARALLVTPTADALSTDPLERRIIAAAIPTITSSLGHLAVGVGIAGLIVAVIAALAGFRARGPRSSVYL